ncbi:MAG TPA: hypothetical protein VEF55_13545 [Candidatus Binatia bacterium]|nr:hypothetical protein [Candidatus Binatia bacterium]
MRLLVLCVIAALAACEQRVVSAGCDVSVTQDLALSGTDAQETITARALGPSCDKAVGLYAIHDAEGHPAWAWAAPLPRAFGDAFVEADEDIMRDFLTDWARPHVATTQTAPEWDALTPGQTTLDRLTYDDIRARDLPMLCHASGTGRELCVFWEPAAGGAGHFFDRDVEETGE